MTVAWSVISIVSMSWAIIESEAVDDVLTHNISEDVYCLNHELAISIANCFNCIFRVESLNTCSKT